MNYSVLNKKIINKEQIKELTKEEITYLERNSLLYYTAQNLLNDEIIKTKIIENGRQVNSVYAKTLELLHKICSANTIPFLLFKTYKYFDEIVDGDIDIIVHNDDIPKLKQLLSANGFTCTLESSKKLECQKEGYKKIEPRVDITHHRYCLVNKNIIWNETIDADDPFKTVKTTQEIDAIAIILNFLYGPKYIKIYDYLLLLNSNWTKIKEIATKSNIVDEIKLAEKIILDPNISDKTFPIFLSNLDFLKFWIDKILFNPSISLIGKFKHIIFSFYIKYKYHLLKNLHFAHSWNDIT